MMDRAWELKLGDRLVGVLTFKGQDMFWSDCDFRPGPAWDDLRPLIARSRDAWLSGDASAARQADDALLSAGLVLHPNDGGLPITDFLLRINGDAARFRY